MVFLSIFILRRKKRRNLQIHPNFELWDLVYPPLWPIMGKFGMQEWTHGVLFRASNFTLNDVGYMLSPLQDDRSRSTKIFWPNFEFGELQCQPPSPNKAKFGVCVACPTMSNFTSIDSSRRSWEAKKQICPCFLHYVVAPTGGAKTKMNMGAQPQTLP